MNEPGKEKRIFEILLEYRVWFFTLLLTDGLCALFLCWADIRALPPAVRAFAFLISRGMYLHCFSALQKREKA